MMMAAACEYHHNLMELAKNLDIQGLQSSYMTCVRNSSLAHLPVS